jgi:hypothetical protein
MISALRVDRRFVWRLRLFAAAFAVVGQLGIFGAYLTLASDESSAVSHTEPTGVELHRGHNDATCASCTVLSFQAAPGQVEPALVSARISHEIAARISVSRVAAPNLLPNSCRAPPREA